jgi:hypothetical protein
MAVKIVWPLESHKTRRSTRTMDELVKVVAERAGIPEDKARTAVNTVMGFLQERLPASIASQLENVTSSVGGGVADMAGDVIGGLGGMLGGKKD